MSNYVTADDIAAKLSGAKRSGAGWSAQCPAHEDKHASLSVSPGQKATVLYCHAGCSTDDVLLTLGLTKQQLFHDYGVSDWRNRNEINAAMARMIAKYRPYQLDYNLYRLDDLMWEALVTEKSLSFVPEDVWYTSLARTGIDWAFMMSADYTEAMMYPTILQHGVLPCFLQPLWEALGRPNLYNLTTTAMIQLRETHHAKGGRREPIDHSRRLDLDTQLTGGPLL